MFKGTKKFWRFLALFTAIIVAIASFITIINASLLVINPDLVFITDATVAKILLYVINHGLIAVIIFASFSVLTNMPLLVKILFYIVFAVIILYNYFPQTYGDLLITIKDVFNP